MIWHFVEVWLLVVLTFVLGCLAGAHLYGVVAASRLAPAQGVVADAVGDAIDRIKARLGLAPTWRPDHLRAVDRPAPVVPEPEPTEAYDEVVPERAAEVSAPAVDVGSPVVPAGIIAGIGRARRRGSARSDGLPTSRQPSLPLPPPAPRVPEIVPVRPPGIAAPRGGVPDNLQRIRGIGKRNEGLLNELGVFHFGQIAAWTPAEMVWIGEYLAFPERIARDDWIGQATLLAMGSETGFQKSAERRRERRRQQREFQERMATASAVYEGRADMAEESESADGDEGEMFATVADDEPHDDARLEEAADSISGGEIGIEDLLPREDSDWPDSDAPDEDAPEPQR